MDEPEIVAAGAVVSRKGPQVLLIHRPKYDDWSLPKGKLDPGEHKVACAVREVAEETGLAVRLGPPLPDVDYLVGNGTVRHKRVHYWAGRALGDTDVSGFVANAEVDQVRWVDLAEARPMLSFELDRLTLDAFAAVRKRSTPLVVLRHAHAEPRRGWSGADHDRPLDTAGTLQSDRLVPLLAAYGVGRIVSSTARRCWTTLAPYAHVADVDLHVTDDVSEDHADQPRVEAALHGLLRDRTPAVVCTHRPVLPLVWAALGVPPTRLAAGAMAVVHHRNGRVVAVEQHALD